MARLLAPCDCAEKSKVQPSKTGPVVRPPGARRLPGASGTLEQGGRLGIASGLGFSTAPKQAPTRRGGRSVGPERGASIKWAEPVPEPWDNGPNLPFGDPPLINPGQGPSLPRLRNGCSETKAGAVHATGHIAPQLQALENIFTNFLSNAQIPNASMAVIDPDGHLVLARGYTYPDAFKRGEPVYCTQPTSIFRVGSLSKAFTAAAVMQLLERRLLGPGGLKRRVNNLIDLTPLSAGSVGSSVLGGAISGNRLADVTVQQLLTHAGWNSTTGFETVYGEVTIANALGVDLPIGVDEVIEYMATQPLQFTPGSQRVYSNYGYVLLGRLVEEITGRSLESYLTSQIWSPLGMRRTSFATSSWLNRSVGEVKYFSGALSFGAEPEIRTLVSDCRPNGTPYCCSLLRGERVGRAIDKQWTCLQPYGKRNLANSHGSGRVKSTVIDLARWLWQFTPLGRASSAILPSNLIDDMTSDQVTGAGQVQGTTSWYGYGWFLNSQTSSNILTHSGHLEGTSAYARVDCQTTSTQQNACICFVLNRNRQEDDPLNTRTTPGPKAALENGIRQLLVNALTGISYFGSEDYWEKYP